MEKNIVLEMSFAFALRIVKLCRYLMEVKKEFVLSKELMVSGTGVGKHVKSAVFAENRELFISEFGVARRKSEDTEYWLQLLRHDGLLSEKEFESIDGDRINLTKVINKIRGTARKHE
ncbi:MAG TPA: four helix bundle protein [Pyrinomonadaceae bacterium]|nr:four helix bundle protein [Pyrinomonadaceae bacterium]